MSHHTHTHPDPCPKDRLRAGRVSPCAHGAGFLTKTPSSSLETPRPLQPHRPDLHCMGFAPAAPSPWLPQRPSTGRLKPDRHANGLRLNGKSNPQEPESHRP